MPTPRQQIADLVAHLIEKFPNDVNANSCPGILKRSPFNTAYTALNTAYTALRLIRRISCMIPYCDLEQDRIILDDVIRGIAFYACIVMEEGD